MNAEAVSQLVTVLEKTTSPDQVQDHNKELLVVPQESVLKLTFHSSDGAEAGPSLP